MIPQDIIGEIRNVTSIVVGIQKRFHGLGINQFAARKVKQNCVVFEMFNDLGSNNTMSPSFSLNVGDIDGNVIGTRHCRCNGVFQLHFLWQFQGRLDRKTRIISFEVHSQIVCRLGSNGSNVTQSHHSQSLALDFSSTKQGLVFFHSFAGQTLFSQTLHVVDAINDSSGSQEQTTNDQFHDRIGIGSRGVEDWNTQFRHASHVDIVGSSTASVCWDFITFFGLIHSIFCFVDDRDSQQNEK
mmetsp:Transcript_3932/g.8427  ORF Transcript_3932/g.8427 Transcript_3932/m.8427 type:complete len:241 (+) Transcript_3932:596-1318(+)